VLDCLLVLYILVYFNLNKGFHEKIKRIQYYFWWFYKEQTLDQEKRRKKKTRMSIISSWPSWWLSPSSLLQCMSFTPRLSLFSSCVSFRLIVLITIRRGILKLQKQIKKIIFIMSMSPQSSRQNTLEKNHVS
jgi:hypothetical protein